MGAWRQGLSGAPPYAHRSANFLLITAATTPPPSRFLSLLPLRQISRGSCIAWGQPWQAEGGASTHVQLSQQIDCQKSRV